MTDDCFGSDHFKFRKREDETPTLRTKLRLSRQDLRAEVPRQNNEVGRHQRSCLLIADDGDPASRRLTHELVSGSETTVSRRWIRPERARWVLLQTIISLQLLRKQFINLRRVMDAAEPRGFPSGRMQPESNPGDTSSDRNTTSINRH